MYLPSYVIRNRRSGKFNRTMGPLSWIIGAIIASLANNAGAADRFEEAPILYSTSAVDNPISRLQEAIDAAEVTLEFDSRFGYLPAVLDALDIPIDSQTLVFSKTSFQNPQISPETPRALYFNDNTYIGTVQQGNVIEVSTTDPNLGTVFYTLEQGDNAKPRFVREGNDCLQCHATNLTRGTPGHILRSLYTDAAGFPILKAGTQQTTQDSPIEERWGGWYVTGSHGNARHMGNGIAKELERDATLDSEGGANRTSLHPRVDQSKYLGSGSDIVALMILAHQTRMHNLMTEANYETRFALRDQAVMDEILERDPDERSDSTLRRIANIGNRLVDYMLFVDEAELVSPIVGTTSYAESFAQTGQQDALGRSLRMLDMKSRMFRYPLSYLIYSEQFDALPPDMLEFVYQRIWAVLNGENRDERFDHLDADTRAAIVEILRATKPGVPEYWKAAN